ncbi:MAG: hypothetical protein FK730_06690 [Asgard group archaeon]|nr:hypothetical protein [Asgard group archaeon]
MEKLRKIFDNKIASKSKKGIITSVIIAVAIFGVTSFIFGSGGVIIGIILSAVVVVAIGAGLFFWLQAVDDLPEAID